MLSITQLQVQIDRFVAYYNNTRPHRARGRITPRAAYDARDKARPLKPGIDIDAGVRVRHDKVHRDGKITLRHRGRMHHINIGKPHRNKPMLMLVAGLDIRVLTEDGELLRHLTLDPTRDYQPSGNGNLATMPRDIQPA